MAYLKDLAIRTLPDLAGQAQGRLCNSKTLILRGRGADTQSRGCGLSFHKHAGALFGQDYADSLERLMHAHQFAHQICHSRARL